MPNSTSGKLMYSCCSISGEAAADPAPWRSIAAASDELARDWVDASMTRWVLHLHPRTSWLNHRRRLAGGGHDGLDCDGRPRAAPATPPLAHSVPSLTWTR